MGVFDFDDDDDDLQPFPRKFRRVQAHSAGSVKDAKQRSGSTVPRQNQISQNEREDSTKAEDNLQMGGFVQEASKCSLPSLEGTVEPEVVVCGEDLISSWGTVHVSEVEFKFTTDAVALKFCDDCGNATTINLPLNEITGFSIRTCEQTRNDILEVTLLDIGMKLLEHKIKAYLSKPVLSFNEEFTLATRIEKLGGSGLARKITSLCDRYKVLWRPGCLNIDSNSLEWRGSWKIEVDGSAWTDLIYPRGDSDAVTVTMNDYLLLNPCEFISDTIVDFYIKYLQSKLPEREKERLHFFNSFFFRKLVNIDIDVEQTGSTFEHIRRWTRDVDIFNKSFLFIPIMQSAHWSLIVVCHPGQLFKQDLPGSKGSSIVHFDSMEGFHKGVEKPIERYLMEQWKHQFSTPIPNDGTSLSVKCLRAKVPQQTNFSDCGLFMLHYVEMFLKALESLSPEIQLSRDWFNPEDVASKRSMLQRLIKTMQEEELQAGSFIKQVDLLPKEAVNVSVPMQGASVVVKVDVSGNNICQIEGESTTKAHSPHQFVLVPDSPASQEKDASLVDDIVQWTPPLLSSGYIRRCLTSFSQPDSVSQIVGVNSSGDLSSGASMGANLDSKDLNDVVEDLISIKTSNSKLGKHCSDIEPESNYEGIAQDSAREVSNSAHVEFTHPTYLLVSSDFNSSQLKPTRMSNTCVSLSTLRSEYKMESLVSDVSADFNHCENGAIPVSSPRCSPSARHETSDDHKSSLDTRPENCFVSSSVAHKAMCLKSSNSGEDQKEPETSQAQGCVDPLYISSDEETGFVKVEKIVEASKAQRTARLQTRQRNASSSKFARGGTARNCAEGTENHPPNGDGDSEENLKCS